jgi:topoisomerase-4 subunit A
LIDFAVAYYENLLKKYGQGRERKTEIRQFEVIEAKQVAIANTEAVYKSRRGLYRNGVEEG